MKPIFRGTSGLNTKIDPTRIPHDPDNVALSHAKNIIIDESGMPRRRSGFEMFRPGHHHSLFSDKGPCFVIEERTSDAAIMRVNEDLTLAGVRSGLTPGRRMGWVQVGGVTFYSNGVENGCIANGASSPWPVNTYNGPPTDEIFTGAPLGRHLAHRNGMMAVSVGNDLFFNHLPFVYGLFAIKSGGIAFETEVLMVKPVASGFFVSDSKYTWFLRGDKPSNFTQELVASYPAHKWGDVPGYVEEVDIGFETPGKVAIWSSTKGKCIGFPDGSMINVEANKIDLPAATEAASLIYQDHQMVTCLF